MISQKGFFSVFVFAFMTALLIGVFYSQNTQVQLENTQQDLALAQQLAAKDWELSREAYSRFASDSIGQYLKSNTTGGTCPSSSLSDNFHPAVQVTWDSVHTKIQSRFGADCVAVVSLTLKNSIEGTPAPSTPEIWNAQTFYGSISCTRKVGETTFTIKRSFKFQKDAQLVQNSSPSTCEITILDVLAGNVIDVQEVIG